MSINKPRQQSLINARRACLLLVEYAVGDSLLILGEPHREQIACLIEEFARLDANSRRPNAGRKPISNPNPKTLAQRRWRAKHKETHDPPRNS